MKWSETEAVSILDQGFTTFLSLSDVGLDTVEFGLVALRSLMDGQVTFEAFKFAQDYFDDDSSDVTYSTA